MTPTDLAATWDGLMADLGVLPEAAQPVFANLRRRYSEPGRFYHTLAHVAHVLADIERAAPTLTVPDANALRLAVWFHDVVYDPRAADNEERSADFALAALEHLGLPNSLTVRVCALILATKTHQAPDNDAACRLLLDADLAVLGADEAEYRAYAEAIRQEYAWVPDAPYREGRSRILQTFLQRPRLYLTPPFAGLEEQARTNLERERQELEP